MAEEEDHYKQSTMIVWPDKEKKGSSKQGIFAGGEEGLLTKKMKKKGTILDDRSKKICVCAPTSHIGSFRCRLHRVLVDGQKPSSSFYSKNNAFMVSGGGGGGSGSGEGQKIRLSRFGKSDCFVASQEENHSGGETSMSYS